MVYKKNGKFVYRIRAKITGLEGSLKFRFIPIGNLHTAKRPQQLRELNDEEKKLVIKNALDESFDVNQDYEIKKKQLVDLIEGWDSIYEEKIFEGKIELPDGLTTVDQDDTVSRNDARNSSKNLSGRDEALM